MKKKQDKYTRSAKGQPCLIRVPGVCTPAPENATTVFCHLNGGGMATKQLSIHGAYGCAECHSWVDGGYTKTHTRAQRDLIHLRAVIPTQALMVQNGVLIL